MNSQQQKWYDKPISKTILVTIALTWMLPYFGFVFSSFRPGDSIKRTSWWNSIVTGDFIREFTLENYTEIHNWLIGIGFPENRTQFTTFRSSTSNTSNTGAGGNTDIGKVGATIADRPFYSDATLTILSNKNNPIVEVRFSDMFPVSLSGLDYTQQVGDVEYLTATVDFRYKLYEIVTL